MTNAIMTYNIGQIIPYHFMPGLIIASYIVSLIGAIVTVELLHRKARSGWVAWLQLFGCAVSFGLVSIWCMHFIGNRAIILGDGRREIQLYYNAGFTALSVILPVVFLFFGFIFAERFTRSKVSFYSSLIITGMAAGLAITGMHYIGNFGTTNYYLHNDKRHIVGSASIAVVSCWVALTLFFHMKEEWINSFWKRLVCANILACAVSGMHWTATIGTTYELRNYYKGAGVERNIHMIIAGLMGFLACLGCFVLMLLTQRRRKWLADRAQHVVLASVSFDPDGRLLVTSEGLIPCQKVTRQYNQRSFHDEFNVSHPVFQWLFRVTYNWPGVFDLIPGMRTHLRSAGNLRENSHSHTPSAGARTPFEEGSDDGNDDDYSAIFRELFCVAASDLATQLSTSVNNLGVLYEDIMTTGTTLESRTKKSASSGDAEAVRPKASIFGKGQLLFLVRSLDRAESNRLIGNGLRFAQLDQVGSLLARSMQVSRKDLDQVMKDVHEYSKRREGTMLPGTYLACFALRAPVKTSTASWDILVPKRNPSQLPMVQLSLKPLKPWQTQCLVQLEGLSLNQCIQRLSNTVSDKEMAVPEDERTEFKQLVLRRIFSLVDEVPEPFFRNAIFSSNRIEVQCLGSAAPEEPESKTGSELRKEAHVFAFCILPDVHSASIKQTNQLTYIPFTFFKTRQRVHKGSSDHATLAHRNHREFSAITSQKQETYTISHPFSHHRGASVSDHNMTRTYSVNRIWPFNKQRASSSANDSIVKSDSSSEKELVDLPSRSASHSASQFPACQPSFGGTFGGIMVSQDITVDTVNPKDDSHYQFRELGLTSVAGVGTEAPTFADQLFRETISRWQNN